MVGQHFRVKCEGGYAYYRIEEADFFYWDDQRIPMVLIEVEPDPHFDEVAFVGHFGTRTWIEDRVAQFHLDATKSEGVELEVSV